VLAGLRDVPPVERPTDRRDDDRRALLASCARCHGVDGRGRGTTAFPRLDLQTEGWLLDQLQAFADGRRASGVMLAATAELTPQDLAWLAAHYAAQATAAASPASAIASPAASDSLRQEGEALFRAGDAPKGVPACVACHARAATARDHRYPALLGQYAGHTRTQLSLYREGKRSTTEPAKLMTIIAGRMTDRQVEAVAAYLAAQPAGSVSE
ncbi:MAG TPA: c-type cytochrome, partial [Reyranella sp.]|nr:c-type cytochrome [Reyranella sp.]